MVPATLEPSPKLMVEVRVLPWGSVEAEVEAVTVTGAVPEPGVTDNLATGGWGVVTLTVVD